MAISSASRAPEQSSMTAVGAPPPATPLSCSTSSSPSAPSKSRQPSVVIPFVGIGRVSDSVPLATYFIGAQAPPTAEIFTRLLVAARIKLKPGQRIRLENKAESIFVFVSPQGDVVTAVVTSSNSYPEENAYQLLTDLVIQAQRAGGVDVVPRNGLAKTLQPVMRELVARYSDPLLAEPPSSASKLKSTKELVIGQRVEVEYEGTWHGATMQRVNPDGSFRVLYHEDNSYEDVERHFIRALSPKPQPGHDEEILFCGVGRIEGTCVLASYCVTSSTEAESLDLFRRLLVASGCKLKAGQKVALANAGGGTVFCMVSPDSMLMMCAMTATCDFPEPDAYAFLDDVSSIAQQHLYELGASIPDQGLQAQMSPRICKLLKKYNRKISPFGGSPDGAAAMSATTSDASSSLPQRAAAPSIAEESELLRRAVEQREVDKLKSAIARAETAGVPQEEIDRAKAVLLDELSIQRAVDQLDRAAASGDVKALEVAIAKAEKLLEPRKNSRRGSAFVGSSGTKRSVRFTSALDEARRVLALELHRLEVVETLRRAINVKDVCSLSAAIAEAESLQPPPIEELRKARQILQEQRNLMVVLERAVKDRSAFEDFVQVNMSDIEAMTAAKKKFRDAMPLLVQLGAEQTMLDRLETLRKKVHNAIQNLKGSIRVFCRIRPLSKKEVGEGDADVIERVDSMTLKVRPNQTQSASQEFTFDAVFLPDCTQEEVFEDTKELVQSALDGYNVALFAYGQTGSGKTYTMTGVPNDEGISPRTIKELFASIESRSARFKTTVAASMLELYRADLVDLLSKGVPVAEKQKLKVRMDKSGVVQVEGAIVEPCKNADELQELLDRGTGARAVAATLMNAESSRSHLILSIFIESTNKKTGDVLRGKIMLVDLAGSERVKKSGTSGNELKESIEINKSLTALGDVIEGLTKNAAVVPYRNHKLTELMQDVIGGSAKTLMFVNCSPATSNLEETLQTLKYATRAKKIVNKIKKMDA